MNETEQLQFELDSHKGLVKELKRDIEAIKGERNAIIRSYADLLGEVNELKAELRYINSLMGGLVYGTDYER